MGTAPLLLSPSDFERVCADLLARLGFTNILRTGKSGDRAITCITPYGVSAVVHCKRYDIDKLVDFPSIQHLMRMIYIYHQAQTGIFITTSFYTVPARELAYRHNIDLIDGDRLVQYALGVMGPQNQQMVR